MKTPLAIAAMFGAFADPTRLRILHLLSRRELCVCDIHDILKLPQAKVSRHLATLRQAGLVRVRKAGLWKHYSLASSDSGFQQRLVESLRANFDEVGVLKRDLAALKKRRKTAGACQDDEQALSTASGLTEGSLKLVLFLCTGNACRSQMAQVIMNHLGKGRFEAFSAGSMPAGYVHPEALRTLEEMHLETQGLRSKSWQEFKGQPFDFVITLCDRAKDSCPVWSGQRYTAHWPFKDPVEVVGTDEEKRKAFHELFDALQARIRRFLALPFEDLSAEELQKRVQKLAAVS